MMTGHKLSMSDEDVIIITQLKLRVSSCAREHLVHPQIFWFLLFEWSLTRRSKKWSKTANWSSQHQRAPRNEIIQPPPHARARRRPKLTTLCVNAIESKILLLFRFFMFYLEMAGVSHTHTHRLYSRSTDILSNESGFVCFFCFAFSPPRFSLSRLEASEQQANCRKRFLVV